MVIVPARVVKPQPLYEDLVCVICKGVLQDPVEGPCEHVACRECLDGWLQRSNKKRCPTCRQTLFPKMIKPAHQVLRHQLDALEVTCDNAARGCTAVVALGALRNHLSSCAKAMESCHIEGFEATMLREDLRSHSQACPHRLVRCDRCNTSIKHDQGLQGHLNDACPAVEVACQHHGGCGMHVRRGTMANHIATECSRAAVACVIPGCKRELARGDMRAHIDEFMADHTLSLSLALQQANLKIAEKGDELAELRTSVALKEDREKLLEKQVATLSSLLRKVSRNVITLGEELSEIKRPSKGHASSQRPHEHAVENTSGKDLSVKEPFGYLRRLPEVQEICRMVKSHPGSVQFQRQIGKLKRKNWVAKMIVDNQAEFLEVFR
eukprot:jgi/Mesvir1/22924/Mv19440-RA.1